MPIDIEEIGFLLTKWLEENPNRAFVCLLADPDANMASVAIRGYKRTIITAVESAMKHDKACIEIAKSIHAINEIEPNNNTLN
jgi:hypothetical protein